MSNTEPIVLEGIPVFTGNLATLDVKVTELSSAAESVATTTGDVHSSFGGLQAFYQAPEAEQLFATTKPVVDTGQKLKSDLTAISRALSTYSDEVYPLVEKLKEIKRDAGAFLVKINADDKWREDGDLVDENNHRRDEIRETWAAFQDAEIACYNKIVALVCGVPLKKHDGSDSAHQYGYDAETLEHVEGLPWGDPLVESIPGWQVWEHAWEFTKGFFVDGVWGTIKGLGTLVGFDGFDAAGQAWKGLAQLATGVAITIVPGAAEAFWTADEKDLPSWLRDSRTAVKETGKALLAWDQWGDNPSRAAGAVTFNVVTTVFTGGTGAAASGAGKAALAAKALTAAGKVGRIVDPMTYVFKGAGAGLSKIGDVMAGLKNLGKIETPPLPDNVFTLPDGWTRLPDGTLDVPAGATLPHGATRLPSGTVKLPDGTIAYPKAPSRTPSTKAPPTPTSTATSTTNTATSSRRQRKPPRKPARRPTRTPRTTPTSKPQPDSRYWSGRGHAWTTASAMWAGSGTTCREAVYQTAPPAAWPTTCRATAWTAPLLTEPAATDLSAIQEMTFPLDALRLRPWGPPSAMICPAAQTAAFHALTARTSAVRDMQQETTRLTAVKCQTTTVPV